MPDNHQEHIIIPIGTVKESTKAGTTILLIPPHSSADELQPQATLLTRNYGTGAHARATVRVLEIQGNMAHLEVLKLEPEWPEGADPLATGQPVYLGLPGSFKPDPDQQGTEAEIEAYLEETHGQGCCPAENLQEAWEAV